MESLSLAIFHGTPGFPGFLTFYSSHALFHVLLLGLFFLSFLSSRAAAQPKTLNNNNKITYLSVSQHLPQSSCLLFYFQLLTTFFFFEILL